jgi:multidrug transporter EmrE-like cation transporter
LHKLIALITVSILLGVLGQYFFKLGMNQPSYKAVLDMIASGFPMMQEGHILKGAFTSLLAIFRLIFKPLIFTGAAFYLLSTVSWLAVLAKTQLSFAYPLLSLGYILVVFMGAFIFKEPVSAWRWVGVVLICIGVGLTGKS